MADELFFQNCVPSWIGVEQIMVNFDIIVLVFLIEGSDLSITVIQSCLVEHGLSKPSAGFSDWPLLAHVEQDLRYVLHKLRHKRNVFHLYFIIIKHNSYHNKIP